MKRIRKLGAVLAAGSLAVVLAACSSQGGAQSQPGAASGGGGGGAVTGGKNFTFAMITHEQAGDTFWTRSGRARRTPRPRTAST
jgi:simple sugar transport system substrate-binding protein